jgi:hypothetical protein
MIREDEIKIFMPIDNYLVLEVIMDFGYEVVYVYYIMRISMFVEVLIRISIIFSDSKSIGFWLIRRIFLVNRLDFLDVSENMTFKS